MSWQEGVPIFDGEDEAELLRRWVRLRATYNEIHYTDADVGEAVFHGLKEAKSRGMQAAMIWGKSIVVRERVRQYILNPEAEEQTEVTKEKWEAEILSVARDPMLSATQKKATIAGLQLYGMAKNWIAKAAEAPRGGHGEPMLPIITYARRSDLNA